MRAALLLTITAFLAVSFFGAGCTTEDKDTINVILPNDETPPSGLSISMEPGYPPMPGLDIPLRCTAYFGNSALQDWTNRMTWTVLDTAWATVSSTGVLRVKRAGQGYVRVTSPESWMATGTFWAYDLHSLEAQVDNYLLFPGDQINCLMSVELANNSRYELCSAVPVMWTFAQPAVMHANSGNVLFADQAGTTVATATLCGMMGSPLVFTVDSVLALQCSLRTASPFLPLDSIQLTATASLLFTGNTNVTDYVTWLSDDPVGCIYLDHGFFIPTTSGAFNLSAQFRGQESSPVTVNVWEVTVLEISPSSVTDTLDAGDTLTFTATGTVTGIGQQDLTDRAKWMITDSSVGMFVAPGVFVGDRTGSTEVFARVGTISSPRVPVNVQRLALFYESWESYPLGAIATNAVWLVYDGGSNTQVAITSIAASGSRGCMIEDSNYSYSSYIQTQPGVIGSLTEGTLDVDVRGPDGYVEFHVQLTDVYNYSVADLYYYSGSCYFNGSYVGTFSSTQWAHIYIEFDCNTDRCNLYIDDEVAMTNVPFVYTTDAVAGLAFRTYSAPGRAYFDNVAVDSDVLLSSARP